MPKLDEKLNMFNIEGILLESEPLWRHTTLGIGGPADYYAIPCGEEDLRLLLESARSRGMKPLALGGGSNVLVADAGVRGLVINTLNFKEFHCENGLLTLGAGLDISESAWRAGSAGWSGLESFFGMPGTVGGAVWMNARCYDAEIADVLEWTEVMHPLGHTERLPMDRREWSYKSSPFQRGEQIILRAAFRMERKNRESLRDFMRQKRNDRVKKGHYRAPCAGSAFKNNRAFGEPSGVLIDRCGLKGLRMGGAAVSHWHANIIINAGGASAGDVKSLLDTVRSRVEEASGFHMEAEIAALGEW